MLGDFVPQYQEREVDKKRLAHLEQQARMTQSEADIEANILQAQMAGLRQGAEHAHQEKEPLEEQLREASELREKAHDLQATWERLAEQAGDLAYCRGRLGKLEKELAVLKKSSEAHSWSGAPALARSETVSSKALVVSIAQMTIGTAPSLAASTTTHQPAASASSTTAPSRQPTITSAGVADTATTVAHSAAQLATGRPYAAHPPPPGFPYLPAGYSPCWGMYPYPYPQYMPPLPTIPLGGNIPPMGASLSVPASEPCPTQVALDPTMARTVTAPEDTPPVLVAPASSETSMPPMDGLEDIDEMEEVAAEGQGAICSVTQTSKMYEKR